MTNNATQSRKSYKKKFDGLGIEASEVGSNCCRIDSTDVSVCTESKDEIFGSAYASAVYISTVLKLPKDQKVYVIGEAGLEHELDEEGIQHIGGTVSIVLVYGAQSK